MKKIENIEAINKVFRGIAIIRIATTQNGEPEESTPANILEAIERGVDMFDCVMPTRNGRNGMLFTINGTINIKNEKWKNDFSPLAPEENSFVDTQYSKAYLRHLIISNEILGAVIASTHNLAFYIWLVREAREQIEAGNFQKWKNKE